MRTTLTTLALTCTALACREDTTRTPPAPEPPITDESAQPPAAARTTTTPTRSDTPAAMRPESDVPAATVQNIDQFKWGAAPPGLPKGAQVAVLEGAPPFPAGKTFTFVAKLPKNYTIPPHTHLVPERVTVLQGALSFGHGEKLDRKTATKVKAGGLVLIPTGHVHYAFTTDQETVIALSGIGPWGIYYVNPKDDPRPTPAVKPEGVPASVWDREPEAKIIQPADVTFVDPPPGMLHPGAKMAVLDGDPNEPKHFTLRLQFPPNFKVRPHTHSATERFIVISGNGAFMVGDTGAESSKTQVKPGAIGVLAKEQPHFANVSAQGLVVQIIGVGPFDLKYLHPEDAPPK